MNEYPFYTDERGVRGVKFARVGAVLALPGGDIERACDEFNGITHAHDCTQIVCCSANGCGVTVENETIALNAGDILVIMPYAEHALKDIACDMMFVSQEALSGYFGPHAYDPPRLTSREANYILVKFCEHPQARSIADEIAREARGARYGYEACVHALTFVLLNRIQRCLPRGHESAQKIDQMLMIKPALTYIRQNYTRRIPLDVLSKLCHMSTVNFRRKFVDATNYTPLIYINRMRIQKSLSLLANTNMTVLEISSAVGFESISSFNRQFLSILRMSPQKWRKSSDQQRDATKIL